MKNFKFLRKLCNVIFVLSTSIQIISCTSGSSSATSTNPGPVNPPQHLESGFMMVGEGGIINKLSSSGQISNVRASIEGLTDVVYGNNRFVAVGMFGIIVSSTDGVNWQAESTEANIDIEDVSYVNNKFIATGSDYNGGSIILYSNDGVSWGIESVSYTTSYKPFSSLAYGNGQFVAIINNDWSFEDIKIATSIDGVNWNVESVGINGNLNSITFNQNRFIAVGQDENHKSIILSSNDSKSWRILNSRASTNLNSIIYAESKFITVGQDESSQMGIVAVSEDGVDWDFIPTNLAMPFNKIVYGNNLFAVLSNTESNNNILASHDLINWRLESSINNSYIGGISYGAGKFVIAGSSITAVGVLLTSTNVAQWQNGFNRDPDDYLNGIVHANNQFIAVGHNGEILSSLDGNTWDQKFSLPGINLYNVAYGNNQFVTVGDNGVILTSSNGESWNFESSGIKSNIFGITYANNRFIAVGENGSILISTDGNTWISESSGINTDLISVVYGDNKFIAVGESSNNILVADSSGTNWQKESYVGGGSLFGITYGNNKYVAFGLDAGESKAIIINSTDGVNWDVEPNNLSYGGAIAFNHGQFVIVSYYGVIITSTDGVNWSYLPSFNGVSLVGICPL